MSGRRKRKSRKLFSQTHEKKENKPKHGGNGTLQEQKEEEKQREKKEQKHEENGEQ